MHESCFIETFNGRKQFFFNGKLLRILNIYCGHKQLIYDWYFFLPHNSFFQLKNIKSSDYFEGYQEFTEISL